MTAYKARSGAMKKLTESVNTMNLLRPVMILSSTILLANATIAGEVDTNDVVTFSAGTPAVAAEINQNFSALIAAINDNAQRISTLENAATSQGNPESLAEKVEGSTYALLSIENFLNNDNSAGNESVEISLATYTSSVRFNEGGSVSFGDGVAKERTITFSPDVSCCSDTDEQTPADNSHTWQVTGSTLTLTHPLDGDTLFTISPDANILVNQEAGDFHEQSGGGGTSRSEFKSSVGIFVRIE